MDLTPLGWSINLQNRNWQPNAHFVCSFAHFAFFIFFLWIIQVKYSEEKGVSPDNSASLLMFYGLASCIARLLAGRVCNLRWVSPHFVFQVGGFASGVSVLLFTVAQSYLSFLLCGVSFGLGNGTVVTTCNLIFLTCVDVKRRASAFGLANCLTSFAIASAPPFAGEFENKIK